MKKEVVILIVDDAVENHQFLDYILNKYHTKVIHAYNGSEAIDMVKEITDIDVVLMDILMPGSRGDVVAKQIREMNCNIKVLAQTASICNSHNAIFEEEIFDDVLQKPFSHKRIIASIGKFVNLAMSA